MSLNYQELVVSANIRDTLQGTPKTWERQWKTWFPSELSGNSVECAAKLFGSKMCPPLSPNSVSETEGW